MGAAARCLAGAAFAAWAVAAQPMNGNAAEIDPRVSLAVEHFLAGRYASMYDVLSAPARDDDPDALRLLILLQRSAHPAKEHFSTPSSMRAYISRTGSVTRLGTGWENRLRELGDPYVPHFLRGNEAPARRLESVRFFAANREWLHAYEIAAEMLHLTGGPMTDAAFSMIAAAGLHDAAAMALRARISSAFRSTDPSISIGARISWIADLAKRHWDARHIGIVDGLADFMVGVGGAGMLEELSDFSRRDLTTLLYVVENKPTRWPRQSVDVGFGRLDNRERSEARRRAAGWWRDAMASGRWLAHDLEQACTKLCPGNLRACDDALGGAVTPRGWVCLTPHARLIPDGRYSGSQAEADCLKKVFADIRLAPYPKARELEPLEARFSRARRLARCER